MASKITGSKDHMPNGKFAPGNKMGVHGRAGTRQRTKIMGHLNEKDLNALLDDMMKDAQSGDTGAREWLLSRYVPPMKATMRPVRFSLDATDIGTAAQSIIVAISTGELAPDTGKLLLEGLNNAGNLGTLAQLNQELAALKAIQQQTPAPPKALEGLLDKPPAKTNTPSWLDEAEEITDV